MADYISREEVTFGLHVYAITVDRTDTLSSVLRNIVRDIPPADVIPRATIESGIEEAIARLNAIRGQAINGDGQLDHPAYLELHDAITGILPEKEADSDG